MKRRNAVPVIAFNANALFAPQSAPSEVFHELAHDLNGPGRLLVADIDCLVETSAENPIEDQRRRGAAFGRAGTSL